MNDPMLSETTSNRTPILWICWKYTAYVCIIEGFVYKGIFLQQEEIGTPENIQIKDISVMRCPEIYDFSSNLYTQQAG